MESDGLGKTQNQPNSLPASGTCAPGRRAARHWRGSPDRPRREGPRTGQAFAEAVAPGGQERRAVLVTLAGADEDEPLVEVEVFHTELTALRHAEATPRR